MRKVLSLDLGITTGFAVHATDGTLIAHGILYEDGFKKALQGLMLEFLPSHSVCERPVIIRGKLGDRLEVLLSYCRVVMDHQVEFVDAAQWKTTPSKNHPVPRGTSVHTKDAIRLGHWYVGRL